MVRKDHLWTYQNREETGYLFVLVRLRQIMSTAIWWKVNILCYFPDIFNFFIWDNLARFFRIFKNLLASLDLFQSNELLFIILKTLLKWKIMDVSKVGSLSCFLTWKTHLFEQWFMMTGFSKKNRATCLFFMYKYPLLSNCQLKNVTNTHIYPNIWLAKMRVTNEYVTLYSMVSLSEILGW